MLSSARRYRLAPESRRQRRTAFRRVTPQPTPRQPATRDRSGGGQRIEGIKRTVATQCHIQPERRRTSTVPAVAERPVSAATATERQTPPNVVAPVCHETRYNDTIGVQQPGETYMTNQTCRCARTANVVCQQYQTPHHTVLSPASRRIRHIAVQRHVLSSAANQREAHTATEKCVQRLSRKRGRAASGRGQRPRSVEHTGSSPRTAEHEQTRCRSIRQQMLRGEP